MFVRGLRLFGACENRRDLCGLPEPRSKTKVAANKRLEGTPLKRNVCAGHNALLRSYP